MVKRIYSIYDVKSGTYGNPVFMLTDGEAIRTVIDSIGDKDRPSLLSQHPEDFQLFYLGDFNVMTGEIAQVKPKLVIDVAQLVIKPIEMKTEEIK